MWKCLLLVSVLLSLYYVSVAQTVKLSGKAMDAATGKPVEYASVVLLKEDSTVLTGMYTQPDGRVFFQ